MPSEIPLVLADSHSDHSNAARRGDVVLRQPGPWSPSVLALLRHLEQEGFAGAPRVVEPGFADDGREMLAFIPGSTPHPQAWGDEAMPVLGALLRDLHRASSSFTPPPDAHWKPSVTRELTGSQPTYGHGDAGPWNVIAQEGIPVAF